MKKLDAIIDPTRIGELREELDNWGIHILTLRRSHSIGRKVTRHEFYRGTPYVVDQAAELEISIVVPDDRVPRVIATVEQHGGEGDIVVSSIDQVVRVSKRHQKPVPMVPLPDSESKTRLIA